MFRLDISIELKQKEIEKSRKYHCIAFIYNQKKHFYERLIDEFLKYVNEN